MSNFKFIPAEVKCNGVGGRGYQSARKYAESVQTIVGEVINTIGRNCLYELAVASGDKHDDFYAGTRFNSNEKLADRLITGLGQYVHSKLDNDELTEMYIGAQLNMLSYDDKQTLVVEAARDCAGADHWYAFEKDWG